MIGDDTLSNVNKVSDLGVCYDNNLHFTEHYQTITNKVMRITFTMNKVFSFSSQKVKLQLYNSFVLPILTYASEVWNLIKPVITT